MPYPLNQLHFITLGDGPPLVLVHGNPASHTLWRPLLESLARIRTVYAIDLPGFGRSPHPDERTGYALDRLAGVVLEWTSLHGLDRFDLVGHSFGGAVSITMTSAASERIQSLALICPLGDTPPPAGRIASSRLAHNVVHPLWKVAPGALRRWVARRGARVSYGPAYQKERAREIAHELNRKRSIESATGVMAMVDYEQYRRDIERIERECDMPLLMLGAGRDRIIPYEHFQRMQGLLTRARQETFPDGGHVLMWQFPERVSGMIVEFLGPSRLANASHPPRRRGGLGEGQEGTGRT